MGTLEPLRRAAQAISVRRAAAACAALLAVALSAGCSSGTGGIAEGGDAGNGKVLFKSKCASCHALENAGSTATVGPDLDDAFAGVRKQGFEDSTIRNIVADQIKYSVAPMPQNLVTGTEVDDVAAYVASVAGVRGYTEPSSGGAGPTASGGGGAPDGKAIFASAGCASCHTLAAAGSTGTVGPNLDQAKPSLQLAVDRVTNGKPPMPSFKGQLSDAEIRAVAQFVASNAGK